MRRVRQVRVRRCRRMRRSWLVAAPRVAGAGAARALHGALALQHLGQLQGTARPATTCSLHQNYGNHLHLNQSHDPVDMMTETHDENYDDIK